MVEYVEEFGAELQVEPLGYFVFLVTEKSVLRKFGPTIVFLPSDPG